MLKDTTPPISVSPVGACPELSFPNMEESWFTGGTYTMATPETATFSSAVRQLVAEEHVILVATKGTLAEQIGDGFAGFFAYRDLNHGPLLEIAGFQLPTAIIERFIPSGLESGSVPVVFADQHGETFVVRYEFSLDQLYVIQAVEMPA